MRSTQTESLGLWPAPTEADLVRMVQNIRQDYGVTSFLATPYGKALSASARHYGEVSELDPYRRIDWVQGWWEAVGDGVVPANEQGLAVFLYWLDRLQYNGPSSVPTVVWSFFHTLPSRSEIYRELGDITERQSLEGAGEDDLRRVVPLIECLGYIRKWVYLQSHLLPPDPGAWVNPEFWSVSTKLSSDAYKHLFLIGEIGNIADQYAVEAGVTRPFSGRFDNSAYVVLLVGRPGQNPITNDDNGNPVDLRTWLPDTTIPPIGTVGGTGGGTGAGDGAETPAPREQGVTDPGVTPWPSPPPVLYDVAPAPGIGAGSVSRAGIVVGGLALLAVMLGSGSRGRSRASR